MQPKYVLNGSVHEVTPIRRTDSISLKVDGVQLSARLQWHDAHHGEIAINGVCRNFYVAQDANTLYIHFNGKMWVLEAQDEFTGAGGSGDDSGTVLAPMPGVVVELYKKIGDEVAPGESLMMIESMKLQTEIKASVAGIIKSLDLTPESSFEKGTVLVEIASDIAEQQGQG